jgi:hypothetical protein
MNQPLVSVVVVVCNVDRFLTESIESILGQTFREFELIILDFGSTDNSKSIISSYADRDSRVKFHEVPPCGLAEARNAVCSLARGRYIAVMDADDIALEGRLMWQVAFMENHPEVGVLGGAIQWIDATGRPLRIDPRPTQDHEIKAALPDHYPFCHATVLMRRDAFVLAGGYRPVFAQAEDYDLAMRMSEHCRCANLKQVVLKHRLHAHQLSSEKGTQQTLCKLAAQASALARKNGSPDPLSSVGEITPAALVRLGVTDARQQRQVALDRYQWIRNMCMASEYSIALKAALEMLQSDLEPVERWLIADLRLLAARLYWKQGRFLRGILTGAQAFAARPVMLGRPVRPLLQWLWSPNRRELTPSWEGNEDHSDPVHV